MSIIACYFIAKTLLLWDPRDIVQIAYHLRQKSPLHFAIATVLLHITHSSKVNCTLCVRKHTILGPGNDVFEDHPRSSEMTTFDTMHISSY